jgi:hypothetical protein
MSRENIFIQGLRNLSFADRQQFIDESCAWLTGILPSTEDEKKFIEVFIPYLNEIYHVDIIPEGWFTVVFKLYILQPLFSQWIRRIPQPG